MSRTKTKSDRRSRDGSEAQSGSRTPSRPSEVLTLTDTAAYLRVTEPEVLRLVQDQGLPGRRVGEDWRFLKVAIERWLCSPELVDPGRFWQTHFGALQEDPYLADIVRGAYRKRGRPEDGEL